MAAKSFVKFKLKRHYCNAFLKKEFFKFYQLRGTPVIPNQVPITFF